MGTGKIIKFTRVHLGRIALGICLALSGIANAASSNVAAVINVLTAPDVKVRGVMVQQAGVMTPAQLERFNKLEGTKRQDAFENFLLNFSLSTLSRLGLSPLTLEEMVELSFELSKRQPKYPFLFHTYKTAKQLSLARAAKITFGTGEIEEEPVEEKVPLVLSTHPVTWVIPRPFLYQTVGEDRINFNPVTGAPVRTKGRKSKPGQDEKDGLKDLQYIFDKTKTREVDFRKIVTSEDQVFDLLALIAATEQHKLLPMDLFGVPHIRKVAFLFQNDPDEHSPKLSIKLVDGSHQVRPGSFEKMEGPVETFEAGIWAPNQRVWLSRRFPEGCDVYIKKGMELGQVLMELVFQLSLITNTYYTSSIGSIPVLDLQSGDSAQFYPGSHANYMLVKLFVKGLQESQEHSRNILRELIGEWTKGRADLQLNFMQYVFNEHRAWFESLPPESALVAPANEFFEAYTLPMATINSCPEQLLKDFRPPQEARRRVPLIPEKQRKNGGAKDRKKKMAVEEDSFDDE